MGVTFRIAADFLLCGKLAMGLAIEESDRNGRAISEFYKLLSSFRPIMASTPTLFQRSHPAARNCATAI